MRFSAYACLRSVHPYDCLLDCFFVSCRLWRITAFRRVGELMEELEHLGRPWVMLEGIKLKTSDPTRHQPLQPLPAPPNRPWPSLTAHLFFDPSVVRPFPVRLRQVEEARQTIKATVAERQKVTELLKDGEGRDVQPWSTGLLCWYFLQKTSVNQFYHWSILKLESRRSKEAELTNSNCCTVNVLRLCALKAWCTLNCILEMHVLDPVGSLKPCSYCVHLSIV